MSGKKQYAVTPNYHENRGKTHGKESDSFVSEFHLEGGKRKGRRMKKAPRTFARNSVSMDNLVAGRANAGYYDTELGCVTYFVTPTKIRSLKGYGKA